LTGAILTRLRRESRDARKNRYSASHNALSTKTVTFAAGFAIFFSMRCPRTNTRDALPIRFGGMRRLGEGRCRKVGAVPAGFRISKTPRLFQYLWKHDDAGRQAANLVVPCSNQPPTTRGGDARRRADAIPLLDVVPGWVEYRGRAQVAAGGIDPVPALESEPTRWRPDRSKREPVSGMPGWGSVIGRGMMGRCPRCGQAKIFAGYLRPVEHCPVCAAALAAQPADDIHPWLTLLIMAHLVGIFVTLTFVFGYDPGPAFIVAFGAGVVVVTLVVLRAAKGVVIGILLKLGYKRGMEDGT
jgi:uncharacterized protein (DUF983 family)